MAVIRKIWVVIIVVVACSMALRGAVESGFVIGVAIIRVLGISIFVVGIIAVIVAAAWPGAVVAVVAVHGGVHL